MCAKKNGKPDDLPSVIGVESGAEGDRTPDLRIANAALCQTELLPHADVDDIREGARALSSATYVWPRERRAKTTPGYALPFQSRWRVARCCARRLAPCLRARRRVLRRACKPRA